MLYEKSTPTPEPARQHPLDGLWLAQKMKPGKGLQPFRSVMHTEPGNRAEAERIFQATGKRLSSNYDYFARRRRVEAWLLAEGTRQGLQADTAHPLYFLLQDRPADERPDAVMFNFPASAIPADKLTITHLDSFYNHAVVEGTPRAGFEIEPRVLTPADFRAEGFMPGLDGSRATEGYYTESQVWLDPESFPLFMEAAQLLVSNSSVITIE